MVSPILKWNAFTNFLIHLSYFITYYNLDSLITNDNEHQEIQVKVEQEINNDDITISLWNYKLSDIDFKLNWPKIVNPFPNDFDYEQDIIGYY